LFGKILDQYGDLIRQRPLNTSFRSSQPIIDAVNQVFTQLPPELPAEAISQWEEIWQEHHCQEGFVPIEGLRRTSGNHSTRAAKNRARRIAIESYPGCSMRSIPCTEACRQQFWFAATKAAEGSSTICAVNART